MELAILTGFGPPGLIDLAGVPPLVSPTDIVVLGYRDAEEAAKEGALDPNLAAPGIILILVHSPALVGADITIYNPALDPDRQYAKQIVSWLAKIVEPASAGCS